MTPDIEAIVARHRWTARGRRTPTRVDEIQCLCGLWDCDAAILLAALDEARTTLAAERRQYGISMKAMLEKHAAAEADADALRKGLGRAVHETRAVGGPLTPCGYEYGYFVDYDESCECDAIAAHILAAHDARRR